jgi:hypothetical protein
MEDRELIQIETVSLTEALDEDHNGRVVVGIVSRTRARTLGHTCLTHL